MGAIPFVLQPTKVYIPLLCLDGIYRIFSNLILIRISSALVFADFLNEKVSSRF